MTDTYVQRHLLMMEAIRLEIRNQTAALLNIGMIQNGGKVDSEAQLGIAAAADEAARRALHEA